MSSVKQIKMANRRQTQKRYIPYRASKAYLKNCLKSSNLQIPDIAKIMGYEGLGRFRRVVKEWCSLESIIPLAYLEIIGADFTGMDAALIEDRREFFLYAESQVPPTEFIFKPCAAVFIRHKLAEAFDPDKSIKEASAYLKEPSSFGFIIVNANITLLIEQNRRVKELKRSPGYTVKDNTLVFNRLKSSVVMAPPSWPVQ